MSTAVSGRHLRQQTGEEQRATNLELFFDLVFVFAVTQLSHLLGSHLTASGLARTTLLLLVVWWAWVYTTWMTNWFDPDSPVVRCLLIAVMLSSLTMAIAIPTAFGDRALAFALGYTSLQVVRNAFVVWATDRGSQLHEAFLRISAWSVVVGVLWIAGALAPDGARAAIWVAALVIDYAGPAAGYWVPRHRPNAGRAVADRGIALRRALPAVRDHRAGRVDRGHRCHRVGQPHRHLGGGWRSPSRSWARRRCGGCTSTTWPRSPSGGWRSSDHSGALARDAYTYVHVVLIAGIIVAAVGDAIVIEHPTASAHRPGAGGDRGRNRALPGRPPAVSAADGRQLEPAAAGGAWRRCWPPAWPGWCCRRWRRRRWCWRCWWR